MENEVWKDIPNYEGLYQASNYGKIISLHYKKTKELKPRKANHGYLKVALFKNGIRKEISVHRMIATLFLDNPNGYNEVNHKDENVTNNFVCNLEWCDRVYNCNYGTRNKRISKSNINNEKKTKKVNQYDLQGNFIKTWNSIKEISEKLGICNSHIGDCCKGIYGRKTSGGYKWKYADEELQK